MRFTPAVAFAILASAGTSFASPMPSAEFTSTSVASSTSTGGAANPTIAATADFKPSLTQQLALADTAADRFALLPDDKSFIFDFNKPQANPGKGGQLVLANRKGFPALVGTGVSMAVGRVSACGMNTLHVHPRAAEFQLVVKGRLITQMVPENGVLVNDPKDATKKIRRNIKTELKAFEATPFYQGSLHTQYNPDCEEAVFVAAFPTEDPGTGQVADETFALTDDVIAATFGQSLAGADIDRVRKLIPASIALGVEACLKKCKIPKRAV